MVLIDYCRAQANVGNSEDAPMDLCDAWKGQERQRRQERQREECEDATDEKKGNGKKGKGKFEEKARATEYCAGYCLQCKAWSHVKKDCWWNESSKSGKDAASLETPTTPAANNTTEPPITGMRLCQLILRSGCTPYNDFLINSGAATSECPQSLADSLGRKPSGPGVELRSVTGHRFTTTGNTTICLRTRGDINVSGDFQVAPKETRLQRSIIPVGQVCDRGNVIVFRIAGGTILNEVTVHRLDFGRAGGSVLAESRHVGEEDVWNWRRQDVDGLRARHCVCR